MIGGATTKPGVVLVVAGALLMAGPVFGFSTLAADRGVNVGTVEDPNALLGIIDNSGATSANIHPSTGQEGDVFFLDDNAGHFTVEDISATAQTFNGEPTALTASVETSDSDNDFVVRVRCGDSNLNDAGELTVQLTAASTLSIELNRTTANPIEVQCSGNSGGGPTADAAGPYTAYEGKSIQLDGTGSTIGSGNIQDYSWGLVDGDGSLENAASAEPTYVAPNDISENTSVTVELTVTDNKGNTGTDEATINVYEESYKSVTADFTYSRSGSSNNVDLDGSPSMAPGGTVDTYEWDIGNDGTIDRTGETVSKADIQPGTDVTLTVTTDSGETDSVTIEVQ